MLLNTSLNGANGCWLQYTVIGNQLRLMSDDGPVWTSPGQPGTGITLTNSQCSVDLSTTTVVANGNTLTISPAISFKSGFQSGMQIYMDVTDVAGLTSGWRRLGWWMVSSTAEGSPSAVSVTPSSGNGTTQQFSFVGSSPNGAANLASLGMLFNTSSVNGCYLHYDVVSNRLRLLSDDGTGWSSGLQPGVAGALSNSQCSVDLSTTTVHASGNTLTVSPAITFKAGFKSGLQIYMNVVDVPGFATGLTRMGWWMVGNTPEAAPRAVSVTPSSGYGTTQNFSFVGSSPNGAANLASVEMLFNTSLSGVNGCWFVYSMPLDQLFLASNDGKSWTQGKPGAAGTLGNSQCSVDLSTTTVVANGNTLTVSPAITFNSGFNVGLQIYMYVVDVPGFNTGWKKMSP
jgi:hypothetical protein